MSRDKGAGGGSRGIGGRGMIGGGWGEGGRAGEREVGHMGRDKTEKKYKEKK